jgi:hypothetical protein
MWKRDGWCKNDMFFLNKSSYIIEQLEKRVEREIEFIWFNCLELRVELSKIGCDKNG